MNMRDDEGERVFGNYWKIFIYTYKAAQGDWDTDFYDDASGELFFYLLWIGCTLLNLIVMLNLLIAIISETFAVVNETALQNSYREKVKIIGDM